MTVIALCAATLAFATAQAADIAAGKQIVTQGNSRGATACIACHGLDGAGNAAAGYPQLAGLSAVYMARQLAGFKHGSRKNPIMQPIAAALSDTETSNVTAYYASLKPAPAIKKATGKLSGDGQRLVELGDWDKTIPACSQCHGPGTRGVGDSFPALAGQHASYLEAQLNAWRQGLRNNDPNNLMKVIANRLDPQQISAVAKYLATLKPAAD